MNVNEQLIHDFYTAFQARDGEKMASFYADDAVFSDPAFGTLRGPEVGAMWRMLCGRSRDLEVTFDHVQADDGKGSAHWEAKYTFSSSKQPIHNVIEASFIIKDGKIIEHHDHFDFWRWSRMALGPLGMFLGWTPLVQSSVRKQALSGLKAFMQK